MRSAGSHSIVSLVSVKGMPSIFMRMRFLTPRPIVPLIGS